jgi:hypothetical protein
VNREEEDRLREIDVAVTLTGRTGGNDREKARDARENEANKEVRNEATRGKEKLKARMTIFESENGRRSRGMRTRSERRRRVTENVRGGLAVSEKAGRIAGVDKAGRTGATDQKMGKRKAREVDERKWESAVGAERREHTVGKRSQSGQVGNKKAESSSRRICHRGQVADRAEQIWYEAQTERRNNRREI